MINHNYKFKTKKYQKKFQNELDHISHNIKKIYKDRTDIQPIVSNYRKVFKITPAKLK
jgi:predicted KAP-like P-loop ATPase